MISLFSKSSALLLYHLFITKSIVLKKMIQLAAGKTRGKLWIELRSNADRIIRNGSINGHLLVRWGEKLLPPLRGPPPSEMEAYPLAIGEGEWML